MLDTGSTKSLISSNLASNFYPHLISEDNFIIQSAHNVSHHHYSVIKPLSKIFYENLQHKFHIFDFNPNYDGLIGLDLLKELNATIDLKNNRLLTRNAVIPIHSSENKIQNQSRQISSLKKLTIPPRCEKIVKIPVNTIQEEKYLPYQKFKPNLEIPASIVNVENSKCYTTIINSSDNEQYFDIKTPMAADDFEIPTNEAQMPNFDIPTNEAQMPNFDEAQVNRYLNENVNQLRLNHLNNKERKTTKDLYFKYKDILYNEKMPLTFNNASQQQIKVKDGTIPTSYTQNRTDIHTYTKKKFENRNGTW
ncbi:hypothetical protein QE152_g5886 [Popillia japonica]|uniref:Uncharacterized protein n=1 Tax=Popillia japonica TaxID=7064 RepID=A0AAW1MKT7_POPJA